MVFNFAIGSALSAGKSRVSPRALLAFGIIANVALLGYFKYADFFIANANFVFGSHVEPLKLLLPLAISFFTFQQIAYLVDSYRSETKEYDFLSYALFVTFFPQLIAGPIVHHKEMMPQFATLRAKVKNYRNILLGIFIFSMGLFKKVAIADTFAQYATQGFDVAKTLEFFAAWQTSLAYTFQLYFDFSGYCDMAIGAALLFNIKLPINFNSPYRSTNIAEFWRRWHITLGRFLRDYVYIPLGGSRAGEGRTYLNLLATLLLSGLWHGAGWTFVFWGFLHGVAICICKFWSQIGLKLPKIIAWFITFNFINASWVFFRANSFDDALKVLRGMIGLNGANWGGFIKAKTAILVDLNQWLDLSNSNIDKTLLIIKFPVFTAFAFILTIFFKNSLEFAPGKANAAWTLYFAVLFLISIFLTSVGTYTEFIYFNF